jgi:hypothetical protein
MHHLHKQHEGAVLTVTLQSRWLREMKVDEDTASMMSGAEVSLLL